MTLAPERLRVAEPTRSRCHRVVEAPEPPGRQAGPSGLRAVARAVVRSPMLLVLGDVGAAVLGVLAADRAQATWTTTPPCGSGSRW